ncbi:MAG: NlpC/P60 family protein [Acidimicrobiales bacterium]
MTRLTDPPRTVVTGAGGAWVATLTDGARSVSLAGPKRTFSESTAAAPVTIATWVRLLPQPFAGTVDTGWLATAQADRSPDVIAIAAQYLRGAPAIVNEAGLQVAGDASYGPLQADGSRQEGSDFNDYLGVTWQYADVVDAPEPPQYRSLDCSGFMRMVWGYRSGMPLVLNPDGVGLPRRAVDMAARGPGVMVIPDSGARTVAYGRLTTGDLVFFDASSDDGTDIDHVGMYLGRDSAGRYRFVSSRKAADGPTMGDTSGRSVLDGTGLYATSFRSARRL